MIPRSQQLINLAGGHLSYAKVSHDDKMIAEFWSNGNKITLQWSFDLYSSFDEAPLIYLTPDGHLAR